jgi:putative MATE family efflux protein
MQNTRTNSKDRSFLGTEPIGKLLLKLALPSVIAQVINMLYNIVDRIYIGHIPETGSLALTGLGLCLPLILIVSAFAALVGSGGAPRASIAMGKGDYKEAEQIMGNCFTLQIIISVILTVILYVYCKPLLLLFGASENTIGYAVDYMKIYSLGTLFVQFTLGMNMFITAQGFATISMTTTIVGAISNIILDPIFIYVFNMGVKGAAIATVISQALSAIWIISFLFGKKTSLKIKKEYLALKASVILPVITLGLATFIMQSTESIISICFNSSLQKYGGDLAVGAMTICSSVMQFAMLPLNGLGQGAQPITSYNFGAKNKERVKGAFKLLLKVDLIYAVTLWLCVMLFPGAFARIFTSEEALATYTTPLLRIYMAITGLFAIQMACQNTFTSIGYAKSSIMVACMRKIVLLIPLIYLLPAIISSNKVLAVYLAEPIADLLSVTFCTILFASQFKKAMKSLE